MTATVYYSSDASAPTLSGSAGSLISVLDACLVNGYGSKSAAGWTKAYSDTNLASYQQATGVTNRVYFWIDDTGTTSSRVCGFETMTGANYANGTNGFPTSGQLAGGAYMYKSSAADTNARAWILVADGHTFTLYIDFYRTSTDYTVSPISYTGVYYFGEFVSYATSDPWAKYLYANTVGAISESNFAVASSRSASQHAGWACRSYTALVGSKLASRTGAASPAPSESPSHSGYHNIGAFTTYPNPISGGCNICRTLIFEQDVAVRGYLKGLWWVLHYSDPQHGVVIPGAGDLSGKSFIIVTQWNGNYGAFLKVAIETVGW